MNYSIDITHEAEEHLNFFAKNNKMLVDKINKLIEDLKMHPKNGIGKPERLKYKDEELYSRRITKYHRMVNKINNDTKSVVIILLYGHYDK